MFMACAQNMGRRCYKKIAKMEDRTKILYVLGQIMYSKACPLDHDPILWVQLQIDIMATKYPNAFRFIEYLEDHWTHKMVMWSELAIATFHMQCKTPMELWNDSTTT
jgi:hypothetical protein